jgi:hypothetical protein
MTYPRREPAESQKTVFFIDCPAELDPFIPEGVKKDARGLSQIERIKSAAPGGRITPAETRAYHQSAQDRVNLLRDQARLVVTSRVHAAVPSLAMGIPVILVNTSFDPRFEILEKYLPLYTPDRFHEIDWNPAPLNLEENKMKIKDAFFSAVRFAAARKHIEGVYGALEHKTSFMRGVTTALSNIPFPDGGKVRYAIWGVCLYRTQVIVETLQKKQNIEFFAAIDTFQSGEYMGRPILQPEQIASLPEDVIVLVPAPSAHAAAFELMNGVSRRFALIKGDQAECFHFYRSSAE